MSELIKYIDGVMVYTDHDKSLQYDTADTFQRFFHNVWLALIRFLPIKFATRIFTRSSKDANYVRENATSHKALEVTYDYRPEVIFRNGIIDGFFTYIWHHLYYAKATRNRLKLVKKLLRGYITELIKEKKQINMLSLGSGSARAVLEVISEFENRDVTFNFLGVDKNEDALDYCRKLAKSLNIKASLILINDKVTNISNIIANNNFEPDIVEMVGLLDYFTVVKATELVRMIYSVMKMGAYFVTCNIKMNKEEIFFTKVVNWPMLYKNEEDMKNILIDGGFKKENVSIILEPLMIHVLVSSKK